MESSEAFNHIKEKTDTSLVVNLPLLLSGSLLCMKYYKFQTFY